MSQRYKPYHDVEDSGIKWLGEIPKHWETLQGNRLFGERKERMRPDDEMLTASQKYGVIPQAMFMRLEDQKVMQVYLNAEILKHVEPDDFVISMRSFQGGLEFCGYSGCVSSAYVGIFALKHVEPGFFKYLFKSGPYIQALQSTSNLVRDGQALRFQNFSMVRLPVVPKEEQKQIAAFLDYETAKIDALIAMQQQLIALLGEKRQAVISHAVTKGLNPDAPMRDSGIEWLGEVPEHWDVRAISKCITKITNGYVGPTRDILVEEGVPYIQATHIKNGVVNFDNAYFVRQEWSDKKSKSILNAGDVLIVQTGAGTGDVGLVSENEKGFNCHALIILASDAKSMSGDYLSLALQSEYGKAVLFSIRTGGMHPHLNCGEVKFVRVPVPPLSEQLAIAEHVGEATKTFDVLEGKAKDAVELLQERRTALISAAVTGKIDVRGWKPPTSQRGKETEMEVA